MVNKLTIVTTLSGARANSTSRGIQPMVRVVGARCDTCGLRSEAEAFFRLARAGMFTRKRAVCLACEPFTPTPIERLWVRGWLVNWALLTLVGVGFLLSSSDLAPFVLVMAQAVVVGGLLVTAWHEMAHAAVARALGAHVIEIQLGRGPPVARWRVGSCQMTVGRYAFLGGQTGFLWLGRTSRWRTLAIVAAGAAANLAAAAFFFWAAEVTEELSELLAAAFGGFGLAHLFAFVFSVWPSRGSSDELPSDGWQIGNMLRQPWPAADPYWELCADAYSLATLRRFTEAAATAERAWPLAPDNPRAPGLLLHALAHAKGPDAALAYYRAHRDAFAPAEEADEEGFLLVNVADIALRARPGQDLELAADYAERALAARPDAAPMLGTQGMLLVERGQPDEGEDLLLRALRATDSREDRAQFASLLAGVAVQRGDVAGAEAYGDVARCA